MHSQAEGDVMQLCWRSSALCLLFNLPRGYRYRLFAPKSSMLRQTRFEPLRTSIIEVHHANSFANSTRILNTSTPPSTHSILRSLSTEMYMTNLVTNCAHLKHFWLVYFPLRVVFSVRDFGVCLLSCFSLLKSMFTWTEKRWKDFFADYVIARPRQGRLDKQNTNENARNYQPLDGGEKRLINAVQDLRLLALLRHNCDVCFSISVRMCSRYLIP